MGVYKELAEAIIKRWILITGINMAIRKARSVSGITVNDDGSVAEISGDPTKVIEDLCQVYAAFSGKVGLDISKKAVPPILEKNPNLQLPQSLYL